MFSKLKVWVLEQFNYLKNLHEEIKKAEEEKKTQKHLINVIKNKISHDVGNECEYYKNNIDTIIRQFFSNDTDRKIYRKFVENKETYDIVSFLNLKLSQKTANQYLYFAKDIDNGHIMFTSDTDIIDVTNYVNAIMIEQKWRE